MGDFEIATVEYVDTGDRYEDKEVCAGGFVPYIYFAQVYRACV